MNNDLSVTVNSLNDAAGRADQFTDALTRVLFGALERATDKMQAASDLAAERAAVAAQVAAIQTRMDAFGAVLEAVGTQKAALAVRLADTAGPMKALLNQQIELLTAQELAVLDRIGVTPDVALIAVQQVDDAATHRRDGRRFARVGSNGNG